MIKGWLAGVCYNNTRRLYYVQTASPDLKILSRQSGAARRWYAIARLPRPENDTKKFRRSNVFKNVHRIALPTIYYTGTQYIVRIYYHT